MPKTTYHHGDLRSALVTAGLAVIAEQGVGALSVAEVARRTEVSAAAPYRHFPTRTDLLGAVAVALARELIGELHPHPADPVESLARATDTYVRFLVRHGAGLELIFAPELAGADTELAAAGRELVDVLLAPALALTGNAADALALVEQQTAVAHGYGTLHRTGLLHRRAPEVAELAARAASTVRALAAAARPHPVHGQI